MNTILLLNQIRKGMRSPASSPSRRQLDRSPRRVSNESPDECKADACQITNWQSWQFSHFTQPLQSYLYAWPSPTETHCRKADSPPTFIFSLFQPGFKVTVLKLTFYILETKQSCKCIFHHEAIDGKGKYKEMKYAVCSIYKLSKEGNTTTTSQTLSHYFNFLANLTAGCCKPLKGQNSGNELLQETQAGLLPSKLAWVPSSGPM